MANAHTNTPGGVPADYDGVVVIVDTSGSMREHGKIMVARNLLAFIGEQARLETTPQLPGAHIVVQWSSDIEMVEISPNGDLPCWAVGGRLDAQALLASLSEILSDAGRVRLLLLSDGHFAGADVAAIKAWRRRHPDVSMRAVSIGPDASTATLKGVADSGGVFPAEEILLAFASWNLPRDQVLPVSIDELAPTEGAAR